MPTLTAAKHAYWVFGGKPYAFEARVCALDSHAAAAACLEVRPSAFGIRMSKRVCALAAGFVKRYTTRGLEFYL